MLEAGFIFSDKGDANGMRDDDVVVDISTEDG